MAAAAAKIEVRGFQRRKPARRPLPEHLPRERVVYPGPAACPCCGGALHKIGEDVTEMLELVPRQWKVIQHVREKFSCRTCEASQAARALARCCSHTCCSQSRRWPTGLAPAPATLMPLVVKADFGCQHAQKQPATRRRWAAITQVGDDSCADVWRHWHLRRRRPLARTTSRRDRQSMLSRVRVATSSARKPSWPAS